MTIPAFDENIDLEEILSVQKSLNEDISKLCCLVRYKLTLPWEGATDTPNLPETENCC